MNKGKVFVQDEPHDYIDLMLFILDKNIECHSFTTAAIAAPTSIPHAFPSISWNRRKSLVRPSFCKEQLLCVVTRGSASFATKTS